MKSRSQGSRSSSSKSHPTSTASSVMVLKQLAKRLNEWHVRVFGFYSSDSTPPNSFWPILEGDFFLKYFTITKSIGEVTKYMKDFALSLICVENILHKQTIISSDSLSPQKISASLETTNKVQKIIKPHELKKIWSQDKLRTQNNRKLAKLEENFKKQTFGRPPCEELLMCRKLKIYGDLYYDYFNDLEEHSNPEESFSETEEEETIKEETRLPWIFDSHLIEVRLTKTMGLGVFATVDIAPKTKLTKYEGPILFSMDVEKWPIEFKTHIKSIERTSNGRVIAGITIPIPTKGVASFINSSKTPNAKFKVDIKNLTVFAISTMMIEKGQQIFVDYVVL